IDELADAIEKYREYQQHAEASQPRRAAIARWRILELLREELVTRAMSRDGAGAQLDALAAEVSEKRRDPYSAVEELMKGNSNQ
ncbi:MAG TPA: hypothetical protein VF634_04810, partial [Pyrinomonadaceae bacterium]